MPIYDYRCVKCETVFALEHGMKDEAPRSQPGCRAGGECSLERFYQPVAIGKAGGASTPVEASPAPSKPAAAHGCSRFCAH